MSILLNACLTTCLTNQILENQALERFVKQKLKLLKIKHLRDVGKALKIKHLRGLLSI
jgi:hypothetical protein